MKQSQFQRSSTSTYATAKDREGGEFVCLRLYRSEENVTFSDSLHNTRRPDNERPNQEKALVAANLTIDGVPSSFPAFELVVQPDTRSVAVNRSDVITHRTGLLIYGTLTVKQLRKAGLHVLTGGCLLDSLVGLQFDHCAI